MIRHQNTKTTMEMMTDSSRPILHPRSLLRLPISTATVHDSVPAEKIHHCLMMIRWVSDLSTDDSTKGVVVAAVVVAETYAPEIFDTYLSCTYSYRCWRSLAWWRTLQSLSKGYELRKNVLHLINFFQKLSHIFKMKI